MNDKKKDELTLSIFIPSLTNNNIEDLYSSAINTNFDVTTYVHKIDFDDHLALLVADRELSSNETKTFYQEIMDYYHGINENLNDEEMLMRKNEVETKWLNGNFNWWYLGAGKKN